MYPEPEKKSDTKFVDKLVKVYQRDGTEEWVLVHIEVQGRHDPLFAKRMFKYYCRIFDRFDRPMTAIAIFSGRDGQKLPDRYECSYQGSVLTKLLYRKGFGERKVHAILSFLHNYVSFAEPETNRIFEKGLQKISGKKNTMGIIEAVAEIRAGEALKKGIRKGLRRGLRKGRAEEKIKLVRRLLARKGYTVKKIADIVDVSVNFVEKIKKTKK
jgi:hypothetical protein